MSRTGLRWTSDERVDAECSGASHRTLHHHERWTESCTHMIVYRQFMKSWSLREQLSLPRASQMRMSLPAQCHTLTLVNNPVNDLYVQFIKPLHLFRLSSVPNYYFFVCKNRARQVHWNANTGRKSPCWEISARASQMSFIVLLWVISASLSLSAWSAFHFDLMEVTINCSSQHQLWSSTDVWVWITLLRFKRLHHALWPRPPRLRACYWSGFIR